MFQTEACDREHTFELVDSSECRDWLILSVTHVKTLKGHKIVTWKKIEDLQKHFNRTTSKRATNWFLANGTKGLPQMPQSERNDYTHSQPTLPGSPPTSCYVKVPVTSAFLHTADSITSSALTAQRNTLSRGSRVTLAESTEFLSWGETQVTAAERDGAQTRITAAQRRWKTIGGKGAFDIYIFFLPMQMCSFIQCWVPCEEN